MCQSCDMVLTVHLLNSFSFQAISKLEQVFYYKQNRRRD